MNFKRKFGRVEGELWGNAIHMLYPARNYEPAVNRLEQYFAAHIILLGLTFLTKFGITILLNTVNDHEQSQKVLIVVNSFFDCSFLAV